MELERFMAEGGIGMADTLPLIAPSVYGELVPAQTNASDMANLARSARRKEMRIMRHDVCVEATRALRRLMELHGCRGSGIEYQKWLSVKSRSCLEE